MRRVEGTSCIRCGKGAGARWGEPQDPTLTGGARTRNRRRAERGVIARGGRDAWSGGGQPECAGRPPRCMGLGHRAQDRLAPPALIDGDLDGEHFRRELVYHDYGKTSKRLPPEHS
jgi:hypothetical protein